MSSDLQAQVTANADPGVAAINQVTGAMDRLAQKTKQANKETQDLQKRVNGNFKEASAGVARAGGPLGSVGGRILGGLGMGGAIGMASVALTAATVAFNALSAASDRAVQAMGKQIDYENQLKKAKDAGEKNDLAQATAGAAQGPTVRQVIAQGGPEAKATLGKLEEQGIDTATAAKGIELVLKRFPNQPLTSGASREAITQAVELTKVGMKFDDAMQGLLTKGGMGSEASAHRSAALVYKDFTGQQGDPLELLRKAQVNVAGDKFLTDEETSRKIRGRIPGIQRGKSDQLEGSARDDLAAAINPVTKALLDAHTIAQAQLDQMRRMADQQAPIIAFLARVGRTVGLSEGSEFQKYSQAQEAYANATFKPDR